jgi:glutamate-1-semialdehyde 2,1-aminomutase
MVTPLTKANQIEESYTERTPKSRSMYERASRSLPGGVAGNGKFLAPYPIYIQSARGVDLVDLDGNHYIDFLMGAGAHILGHIPACVLAAVKAQIETGTHLYLPSEAEVKLAEKICKLMAPIEMVRFVNTGSEATANAMRAVRAYRGRDKILKFEGAWHGVYDEGLVSMLGVSGTDEAPLPHLDCAGVPQDAAANFIITPYNDIDRAVDAITRNADELAGVIVEPVSGFGIGVVSAEPEFLKALREVTAKYEIPLIFDEVVTNFRLALGGATEYFGIKPDMVTLGKIPGGGFPFGGFGGRRDIMEKVLVPHNGAWDLSKQMSQSGTFSGNPVTMTAGLAVIDELEKRRNEIYPYIENIARQLADGIQEIGERKGFEILANRVTSIFQIHFGTRKIRNKRDLLKADKNTANIFHQGLITHGVLASYHPLFVSSVHTPAHVQKVLEAAEEVLTDMQ